MTIDFDYSAFDNLEKCLTSEIERKLICDSENRNYSVINREEACKIIEFDFGDYLLVVYDSGKILVIKFDGDSPCFADGDVILSSPSALAFVFSQEVSQQYFDLKSQKEAIQTEKHKTQKENHERILYEQLKKKFK